MTSRLPLAPCFRSSLPAIALAYLVALPGGATFSLDIRAQAATADELYAYQLTLGEYCVTCHNDQIYAGELTFDGLNLSEIGEYEEIPEKILAQLRSGQMPPTGMPRPPPAEYEALANWLESALDQFALDHPNPGRTESFHRLNRAEYANAVRDLLALDVDVEALLPADDIAETPLEHSDLAESVEQFTIELNPVDDGSAEVLMNWATLQLRAVFNVTE